MVPFRLGHIHMAFWIDRPRSQTKAALAAVREAFCEELFSTVDETKWPRISVIICTHNGARRFSIACGVYKGSIIRQLRSSSWTTVRPTTRRTLRVNFPFHLISISHLGLSTARNVGLQNATGEIVAYIDDDARPDPHWLRVPRSHLSRSGVRRRRGPNIRHRRKHCRRLRGGFTRWTDFM